MTTAIFNSVQARIEEEPDPVRRARIGQFILEVIRHMPQLTVSQAASTALQIIDVVNLHRYEGFGAITQMVQNIQLRPAMEWHAFGYGAKPEATEIVLDVPTENPGTPPVPPKHEVYYLVEDTMRTNRGSDRPNPPIHLPSYRDTTTAWRKRLGYATQPNLSYMEFGAGRPIRRIEMLGNLWKIGAVATWERDWEGETSWCLIEHPPETGDVPFPMMSELDCWYHLRIHHEIGRDGFAEIARCLGEIFTGYVQRLWEDEPERKAGELRGPESEAAGYIALERLWVPMRGRRTSWYRDYTAGDPAPAEFRWDAVIAAAEQIEDLLRGDTEPVTAA